MVRGRTFLILLCFVAVSRPANAQPQAPPALPDVEGVATYGRFRQFQVDTTETFQIKR
jgi:hypothetical protein